MNGRGNISQSSFQNPNSNPFTKYVLQLAIFLFVLTMTMSLTPSFNQHVSARNVNRAPKFYALQSCCKLCISPNAPSRRKFYSNLLSTYYQKLHIKHTIALDSHTIYYSKPFNLFSWLQSHIHLINISLPLFFRFWIILENQNMWSDFNYSIKNTIVLEYTHYFFMNMLLISSLII